ncbi:Aste57867_14613 [Aphanomyces stellatus]|uniref:Aste57867_14613 protein n=1 Tax=Aphanomyces stellatus TaxID=120398 RepID=A0A485L146_9STRA|nr:hypothetical protein As57867_014559 [Aphanomyces stellatus]VFT91432.1 Aste57867_14613 [Aphanomyces stellatus]
MIDKRYLYQFLPFVLIVVVFVGSSIPVFLSTASGLRVDDGTTLGYKILCSDIPFGDEGGAKKPYVNVTVLMAQIEPTNLLVTTTSFVQGISAELVNATSGQVSLKDLASQLSCVVPKLLNTVRLHIETTVLSISNNSPITNAPTTTTSFLNDGTVAWYPFDTYQAQIDMRTDTGDSSFDGVDNAEIDLNVIVVQHEDFEWNFYNARIERPSGSKKITLKLSVRRDFNVYTAFVFIGIWAVTFAIAYIGSMAVIWKRRAPDNPVIFISALFAVPAFRNTCPGSPPYGVLFDVICTYFAIAVICTSLVLVSIAYMRKPKPTLST